MTILQALRQLRDDLKTWCINNFNLKLNKNLGAENANKFLMIDNNGDVTTIGLEATKEELDYVAGVTSSIQEQFANVENIKADKTTTEDIQNQVNDLRDAHSTLRQEFDTLKSSAVTVFTGTSEPTSDIGEDGDLYLVLEE